MTSFAIQLVKKWSFGWDYKNMPRRVPNFIPSILLSKLFLMLVPSLRCVLQKQSMFMDKSGGFDCAGFDSWEHHSWHCTLPKSICTHFPAWAKLDYKVELSLFSFALMQWSRNQIQCSSCDQLIYQRIGSLFCGFVHRYTSSFLYMLDYLGSTRSLLFY